MHTYVYDDECNPIRFHHSPGDERGAVEIGKTGYPTVEIPKGALVQFVWDCCIAPRLEDWLGKLVKGE